MTQIWSDEVEAAMAEIRQLPKVEYSREETLAIKAGGRITDSAKWDCASPEQRATINPALNPKKRWFEQKAFERFDNK